MVQCYLCKGKLRVTRDKHVYDEKLKKRYHFKCFAGICRVCDMPVYTKAKHKTIGSNVWHELCYGKSHEMRRRRGAFDDGYYPEPGELEALGISRAKKDKYFRAKNPRRPTKEFWDKHYPEVLAQYKKKYPKAEAEERARKATAAIWYDTMGAKKKAKYEQIRRKREARENPIKSLMFSGDKAPAAVFPELEGKKTQLRDGWWIITDSIHNRQVLGQHQVPYTRHTRPSAAEIVRAYDEQRENPPSHDTELKRSLKTDLSKLMEETRYLLVPAKSHGASKMVEFHSLRPVPVQEGLYSIKDTPEARRILDKLGMAYTPYRMPKADIDRIVDELFRARKNPVLVTPETETDIVGAFQRVIEGVGTQADKALVRMAREADVIMSTGPSVLLKHNPKEPVAVWNPVKSKVDYIIQDEFGKTYETGTGTQEEAETRALVFNRKYMREFKVIYPKTEPADVKKAAESATKELLKS